MIKYLVEKEFKQIFRNVFIPKILVGLSLAVVFVFPWAASQEIHNIRINVVDSDHSLFSRQLTNKIAASDYFVLAAASATNEEALRTVETGEADVILEIPPRFERDLMKEGGSRVMISSNAVNSMKGGLAAAYLNAIVNEYADRVREKYLPSSSVAPLPVIAVVSQNRFNPHLDYKVFMIPALMVMLLTLICGFLPTFNIVSEKELGTIEQINVTPVSKFTFIIAKMIPYWVIGVGILSVCLALVAGVYGLIPRGNIFVIYCFTIIYILTVSGMGIVISNYSATMQQAMFGMFFFVLIMMLMSGLFTPVSSMPRWAQYITLFNPLKYFIQVMRMVFLKGSHFSQLGTQLAALGSFALFFNIWAVWGYRKKK